MNKWSVREASVATGLSDSTFTACLSDMNESTKGGITFSQILKVLEKKRRNTGNLDMQKVEELKKLLVAVGYLKDESEDK